MRSLEELKEEYSYWKKFVEKIDNNIRNKGWDKGWNGLSEGLKEKYEIAPEMMKRLEKEMFLSCLSKEKDLKGALKCYKELCEKYNLKEACKKVKEIERKINQDLNQNIEIKISFQQVKK